MNDNHLSATSTAFREQLRVLKNAEIATGVGAPDRRLIWFCCTGIVGLVILCMFLAVFGDRAVANLVLLSLWPLFGLLTFFQRSSRFKQKVQQ